MKWTKERPTKSGWYWVRGPDWIGSTMANLEGCWSIMWPEQEPDLYFGDQLPITWEFAGPIPEPEEV